MADYELDRLSSVHGASMINSGHRASLAPVLILCLAAAFDVYAAPVEPIRSLAAQEKAPLLGPLKELVSIVRKRDRGGSISSPRSLQSACLGLVARSN